jgi:hypothetical protein
MQCESCAAIRIFVFENLKFDAVALVTNGLNAADSTSKTPAAWLGHARASG